MREILFRGKTDKGEWVQGVPFVEEDRCYIIEDLFICDEYDCTGAVNTFVIPETIGQYTGLTDKNGKKIFEGDYWLDTDGDYLVYVVEFREGQFGFVCYGIQGVLMPYGFDEDAGGWGEIDFSPFTDWNMDLMEIDGNIHDDPELLKGGEG